MMEALGREEGDIDTTQMSGQGDRVCGMGPQDEEGEDLKGRIHIFFLSPKCFSSFGQLPWTGHQEGQGMALTQSSWNSYMS